MRTCIAFLCLLISTSISLGQTPPKTIDVKSLPSLVVVDQPIKAVIKGPSQILAGTLLFLSSEDAVGDNKVWMIPDEIRQTSMTCGSGLFFAIQVPGTYKFGLIVANKSANIDYIFHTVQVIVSGLPPTPPTTPGQPPPPSVNYEALRLASVQGIVSLNDPVTASDMYVSLATSLNTPPGTRDEVVSLVVNTISTVLARRSQDSFRTKDWLNLWRIPINNELMKVQLTREQYIEAMKIVALTCKG